MTSHWCLFVYIFTNISRIMCNNSLCCNSVRFVICCIFPGLHSSAGFKRRGQENGRAGEWTMFTLGRPAQGSAAATAIVQVEWSASVMRDTMVGHKQHIIFKLLNILSILKHLYCSTIMC